MEVIKYGNEYCIKYFMEVLLFSRKRNIIGTHIFLYRVSFDA